MKCTIPEISWHNRDPVLSVDIQPKNANDKNDFYRLASGGTDSHVLIWYMTLNESGSINLDLATDLTRHQRAVNTVKWSPNGELLASGDDESVIFIWKQKTENEIVNIVDTTIEQDKEIWITLKILRGHMEDVYDLSWSPNSQFLASGSVDNTAMVWDISKGKSISILNDHKGFVQGVAWDPQNQYLATLSTDRFMRVFDIQTKKVVSRLSKCTLPVPADNMMYDKSVRLFHDDTLQTFFRRLCFSPDGKLLIAPAGLTDFDGVTEPLHTTYIFSRYSLKQPAIVLPSPDQYTVAVECCPLLFKLRPHSDINLPVIPLPYRMIFAVATKTSVYLYDTQQIMPFGMISNIHYTRLTDLTWSNDAKVLVVSSTDGFCSLITFTDGELGDIFKKTETCDAKEMDKENIKRNIDNTIQTDQIQSEDPSTATPIKTRRKPRIPSTDAHTEIDTTPVTDVPVVNKIISSNEKFESPEKKNRPVTPISIRRHPRSLSTSASQAPNIDCNVDNTRRQNNHDQHKTPERTNQAATPKTKSGKKTPVPIAIRRQPRSLIPNPVEKTIIVEEAIDAWPLDQSPPKVKTPSTTLETTVDVKQPPTTVIATGEYTQDMRLVYEDSQAEKTIIGEEAIDALPLDQSPPKATAPSMTSISKTTSEAKQPTTEIATTGEYTDDIRLIYEESQEEVNTCADETNKPIIRNENKERSQDEVNASAGETDKPTIANEKKEETECKTPRRVPLKTISTPKSKKKQHN